MEISMFVFKRKQVVISVIFCMVLVAGYINWAYQPEKTAGSDPAEKPKYLGEAEMVNAQPEKTMADVATKAKIDSRNKAIEVLNSIANNPSADERARSSALEQISQIADNMEKESICEGILNSKGFGETVVYIADEFASVTVSSDTVLTGEQVAQIGDVIVTNTSIPIEKVKINKAKG